MEKEVVKALRLAWLELVHVGLPHGAAGMAVKALLEKSGGLPKIPKPKRKSRSVQWSEACMRALDGLSKVQEAVSELSDLRSEYESWRDNLPENLQTSAVGEKLDSVCDLDLDSVQSDLDTIHSTIEEAESLDLPLGYGKD